MIPSVNALAIIVAAASAIVLGFLWYGPFFGKPWMKLMGFSKDEMQKAMKNGMGKTYALQVITALVTAYVLSIMIWLYATYVYVYAPFADPNAALPLPLEMLTPVLSDGIITAFWVWLGFNVPILMDPQMWEGKPWKLFWINASYRLVSLLVMGAILASWV